MKSCCFVLFFHRALRNKNLAFSCQNLIENRWKGIRCRVFPRCSFWPVGQAHPIASMVEGVLGGIHMKAGPKRLACIIKIFCRRLALSFPSALGYMCQAAAYRWKDTCIPRNQPQLTSTAEDSHQRGTWSVGDKEALLCCLRTFVSYLSSSLSKVVTLALGVCRR